MKRIAFWIVGIPIAVVAIALSVANRQSVSFSFDPVSTEDPFYSIQVPLFLLLFAAAFIGLLVGWLVGWAGQHRHRAEERRLKRENETLKATAPARAPTELATGTGQALIRAA